MKRQLTDVSKLQNSPMADVNPEMNQPTILLTGFDAFGGDATNPSWLAVQALSGEVIEGHSVVAAQLPTEFAASKAALSKLLRKHRPALVLCVGLAGGRSALSLERIAINMQDARIPDNAGAQPIDIPILRSGPAAFFTTLPIKSMLQAMTDAGIDANVSQTAGTFVCNHVFYLLMHTLKKQPEKAKARGGFIHLPYLPGQGLPCMPLSEITRGLRVALTCAVNTQCDALIGAGSLN
jgi:pyroglutamyl-peptidase